MTSIPFVYLSPHECQGDHGNGWSRPLDFDAALPPVSRVMEAMEPVAFDTAKTGFLFEDDLLHPLRIQLEKKVPAREISQFLLWKLKRFLPYPVDQVDLRYVPLKDPNTFLTFSLHRPWLQKLQAAFKAKQVHCGYMGGLFATLLENQPFFRNKVSLCLYPEFYLLAELDGKGNYLDFQTRRLPYDDEGRLDLQTLISADLGRILKTNAEKHFYLLNFARRLDPIYNRIAEAIQGTVNELAVARLSGPTVARFRQCLDAKGSAP